jgi:hypothetical protein
MTIEKISSFVPCAAHAFNNMMPAVWGIVCVRMSRLLIVIDSIRHKSKFRLMAEEAHSAGRLQGGAPKKGAAVIAAATSVQ